MRCWNALAPAVLLLTRLCAPQEPVLRGDYLEDRSNHVHGCYCEWSGESVTGGREAILAWKIRSGTYRGANLAGVRIAAVIRGEGTLSIGSSPRPSVLLIESSATKAQRQAAERLVREHYGHLVGTLVNVRAAEIDFTREPERAVLRIKDLLNVEMRKAKLPEDGLQGAILWFDPFIPLEESTLGTSLQDSYSGPEFNYLWSKNDGGTTGYFGTFSLTPR